MTKRFLITISGCILLVAVVVVAAVVVIIPRLLDLDSYREQIVAMAEKSLNRNVSYKTGSVSWHFGPSFVFRGVIIEERSGGKPLLEADRFSFKLALLPLLRKEVRIRELVLERPVLVLNRNEAGQFNIDDLFTAKPSKFKVHVKAVRIKNGLVLFTDHFYDPEGFTASLENLDLTISSLSRGTTSRFRLSTVVPDKEGRSEVSVSGTTGIPAQGEPSGDVQVDAALSAKNLNVGRYWPYYGRYLPFEKIHGNLDIDGMFKGKPTEFTTKGSIRIRNLLLNYPQVFHAVLTPKELQLGYDVELTPRNLSAISLNLTVDGLRVKGSFALDDIHGSDPRIIARASTSPFRLEEFRRYIPYGVIAKDTADFIEQHIKGGIYRLDEGSLNGRVSRILHMDRDDNYNVLSIRGSVDEGLVTIGPRVPTFNNIRGELEIRGKDFIMRRMTGNFGGSPFSLEGKIADFPLDKPSSYPFDMTITPRQEEVFWLSRQGKSRKLAFNGPSVLRLSGSGIAADYRLAGSWDLSRAEYNFKQLVHKRAGLTNRITFSARLGKTETRLSDLRYRLPPLELSARATYRFKDKESLSFVVDTNRFTMGRSLPIFPGLSKYRPTGTLQTHIEGRGNPARADSLRLNGSLSLAGFSVRPIEQIRPLSGIRGTIRFTESSLETKRITGRLGHSAFSVKGRVAGVSNPTVDVDFSSPALHPDDLGYRYQGERLEVKDLSGRIFLKDGNLTINSLSGRLNRSAFEITGDVHDIRNPKIALNVSFPFLRVEDMTPLTHLKHAGSDKVPDVRALNARVTSRAGTFSNIPFEKLDTELSLEDSRLVVQDLNVGVFGGSVSGNGQADFAARGGPMYDARYRLNHIDAAKLLRAAGAKVYITGLLAAEGRLTAWGDTIEKLKKTASGYAKIRLREGGPYTLPATGGGAGTKIPTAELDAILSLKNKILTIHGLKASVLGGTVCGDARVDFAALGGTKYQAHYCIEQVDAFQLLRTAGVEGYFSGLLSAKGELTVRGNSADEWKKNARVSAQIELNNGMIRPAMHAGSGTARAIPFEKLFARISFERNVLDVYSTRIDAFGGVISGHGAVDFHTPLGPAYRVECRMEFIDAAEFFRAFGVTKNITGLLSLRGELTARGDSAAALKKTVRGSVGMYLEKGVINRFHVLSKVFSILNVSQLLNFRLPDMLTDGMPYDRIEGNLSINDGIVSTSDLSIDSPSINVTIVGKTDIVKEYIDLTIGVQPLQTVGEVVGRIPVIGWILTGGNRQLLVTYYEARGKWDDPKVSAIPVTSLTRGVFNIFKRAFSLPGKMITDTGEVIMGK
jgi:uncharacterized protein involved in outer membrane biogenesis